MIFETSIECACVQIICPNLADCHNYHCSNKPIFFILWIKFVALLAGYEGSTGYVNQIGSNSAQQNSRNHGVGGSGDEPPDEKPTKIPAMW